MELYLARQAGLCYGLRRALRMIENHARRQGASTLAIVEPFSDSPTVETMVRRLGIDGIDRLEQASRDMTLALPLDGIDPMTERRLKKKGLATISTSCPRQSRTKELAYKLAKEGYPILVLGKPDDQEAAGILDWAEEGWTEQLDGLGAEPGRVFAGCVTMPGTEAFVQIDDDVAHVAMLSSPRSNVDALGALAEQGIRRFSQVRAYNTTCHSVTSRRIDAARLGKTCDLVIVMGRKEDKVVDLLVERVHSEGADALVAQEPENIPDLSQISTVGLVSSWDVEQSLFVAMVEYLRTTYSARVHSTL